MRTKEFLLKTILLILISGLIFSCKKEDDVNLEKGEVNFLLNLIESSDLKSALSISLEDAEKIILTIQKNNGEPTDYTNSELNLYKMNDNFFSEKIALNVGSYKLVKFILLDINNNAIFAAPLEGSQQASNVDDPLPIAFIIEKDQASSVNIEVLSTIGCIPEDFGLVSFWIEEVETFCFLIAVAELGQDILLTATLTVTSNNYSLSQELEAIANNVVTVRDGINNYTLTVTKDGYASYEQTFTNAGLKAYETKPLVVELITTLHDPILEIVFDEHPYNHNMHITSDETYLYTINGGNTTNGKINKFTYTGSLVASYPITIDGRGLSYNKADGYLYASLFLGNIVKITDLQNGTYQMIYQNKMQNSQASFAISPDGTKMYDFYNGTVKIYNFITGALLNTITGLSCGSGNYGGNAAIAVDEHYMYTWNAQTRTVYVYTLSGTHVRNMSLSHGDNGHSLSVFDGYLFVSKDGNYSVGTWYGYNIRRPVKKSAIIVEKSSESYAPKKVPDKFDTIK